MRTAPYAPLCCSSAIKDVEAFHLIGQCLWTWTELPLEPDYVTSCSPSQFCASSESCDCKQAVKDLSMDLPPPHRTFQAWRDTQINPIN